MKTFRILLFIGMAFACYFANAQTRVIAHRGYWKTAGSAQNSIASLYRASGLQIYGSEFDVQITADDEAVVNHDDSIGGYHISSSTSDLLSNVHLANGEPLPTLSDYLKAGSRCDGIQMILEIKPHWAKQQEEMVTRITVDKVRAYNMQARTEYISFSLNVCEQLVSLEPTALVSYLGGDIAPKQLFEKGIRGIDYRYSVLLNHPEWIQEAHDLGMVVNTWTVDDMDIARQLIGLKVDFITTNLPIEVKKLLK